MSKIKTPCPIPFTEYKFNKFFHPVENRYYVHLYPVDRKSGLHKRSMSYARYLMSVHLGRELDRHREHVDHIDNDQTNDVIENLQILTPEENNAKAGKGITLLDLVCDFCGENFQREKRQSGLSKGYKKNYCSRKCSGKASTPPTKKKLEAKDIKHGTKSSYSYHGCRCTECTEANTLRNKQYRESKKVAG